METDADGIGVRGVGGVVPAGGGAASGASAEAESSPECVPAAHTHWRIVTHTHAPTPAPFSAMHHAPRTARLSLPSSCQFSLYLLVPIVYLVKYNVMIHYRRTHVFAFCLFVFMCLYKKYSIMYVCVVNPSN